MDGWTNRQWIQSLELIELYPIIIKLVLYKVALSFQDKCKYIAVDNLRTKDTFLPNLFCNIIFCWPKIIWNNILNFPKKYLAYNNLKLLENVIYRLGPKPVWNLYKIQYLYYLEVSSISWNRVWNLYKNFPHIGIVYIF